MSSSLNSTHARTLAHTQSTRRPPEPSGHQPSGLGSYPCCFFSLSMLSLGKLVSLAFPSTAFLLWIPTQAGMLYLLQFPLLGQAAGSNSPLTSPPLPLPFSLRSLLVQIEPIALLNLGMNSPMIGPILSQSPFLLVLRSLVNSSGEMQWYTQWQHMCSCMSGNS